MNNLFEDKHIYSVTDLTKDIRELLTDSFPNVWVKGEVSTLRLPQSGHMYFTLKDKNAQLKCVFFRNANMKLKFKIEEGMECILLGRISVYDQSGQYQLYVESVEPVGKGAMLQAFEQLKKKLEAEGLFDKSRKREIPFLPKKIGVVTSSSGAAIRDILNIIGRRFANVHIIIRPCLVQGKTAALDIAQGIKDLNDYKEVDVIIVGRGGGSLEDLWAFNEEPVARAVYNSKIPVISAVGHEIDFTICDFAADLRAPTPSAAAELVVREKEQIVNTLDAMQARITESITQKIRLGKMRFERLAESYAMRRPQVIVERYQQDLDNLQMLLSSHFDHVLKEKQGLLKQISARLVNLNPLAILSRGYSITYLTPERKVVKNTQGLKKGDIIETKLHKGVIISQIKETKE
ncbi:MAG: exodeoxyribonuclease VII large subunit [Candidatus Omnitrophica bacterium]|nr:exodeoxyribonuclease VII large subunit [Candidatus Omnitrophota bacterium]